MFEYMTLSNYSRTLILYKEGEIYSNVTVGDEMTFYFRKNGSSFFIHCKFRFYNITERNFTTA